MTERREAAVEVTAASPSAAAPVTSSRRGSRPRRLVAILAAVFLVPVVVVVGVAAAGIGSAGGGAYRDTVHIDIHYSHYEPSQVSVPVGVPVRFVIRNLDPIDHEWIVGDAATHARHRTGTEMHHGARATEISIGALTTAETVITFPATGSLQFICHLPGHEQYGMVGTLDIR